NCVTMKYRRRSRMSASAPLGSPSRNTGSVDAVCTSATHNGDGASDVMSQADATSFIHIVVLAAIHVAHNMRKTGRRSGASADRESSSGGGGVAVCCSGIKGVRWLLVGHRGTGFAGPLVAPPR